MAEWTQNLLDLKPSLEDSIKSQVAMIRQTFDECFVTGHIPLIEGLEMPDHDDGHVLAAAIRCSAQVIVTENKRDFPPDLLEEYDIEVLGADEMGWGEMLVNTYELFPVEAARACARKGPRALQEPTHERERVSTGPHPSGTSKTFCYRQTRHRNSLIESKKAPGRSTRTASWLK